MKLKAAFLWQPDRRQQNLLLIAGMLLVTAIGYLHTLTGLSYEFHAIFFVPVLVVSWFSGSSHGIALGILAAIEWFLADRMLLGDRATLTALLFNTTLRLTIFIAGAWLVGQLRRVLLRESQLAREDVLTELPNRREFLERGEQAFALAQRQGCPFAAVFIDLDRFKEVNDTLGHEVGDHLLKAVASAMRAHVRVSDIPGRLGGDEFALLLPNMKADATRTYVEELRCRLCAAMQENGWPVTFSIGVASYQVTPPDFFALLKQADDLMYEVKRGERDHILLREYA